MIGFIRWYLVCLTSPAVKKAPLKHVARTFEILELAFDQTLGIKNTAALIRSRGSTASIFVEDSNQTWDPQTPESAMMTLSEMGNMLARAGSLSVWTTCCASKMKSGNPTIASLAKGDHCARRSLQLLLPPRITPLNQREFFGCFSKLRRAAGRRARCFPSRGSDSVVW